MMIKCENDVEIQTYQRLVAQQIKMYNEYGINSFKQFTPQGIEYELNPFSLPPELWSYIILPEVFNLLNINLSIK